MSVPEDLSANLPAPRPDEPAALRQDIADEIADHLHCAARREHLQNSGNRPLTDQAAFAAAVERFGEPAVMARRLWWDAMKERIMAQRVMAVMATAVAGAAIFACVVLWQATQASRAEQAAMIQSQQALLTAMLSEMKSSKKADSVEWQTLKIRLIDEQGRPVRGNVNCTSQVNQISDSLETGADGVAEFHLPSGQYGTSVTVGAWTTMLMQLLPPERPMTHTVVCPSSNGEKRPLQFTVDGASDDLGVYYVAQIQANGKIVAGQQWSPAPYKSTASVRLLINPQGQVLGQLGAVSPQQVSNSNAPYPGANVFPKRIPAGVTLTPPTGFAPGSYSISVAPYVPAKPPANAHNPYAAVDVSKSPELRSVWWPGGSNQITVDTQAEEFSSVTLDDTVFNWENLRAQIAAGTPSVPYSASPYASPGVATYAAPSTSPPPAIAFPHSGESPHADPPTAPATPPISPSAPPSTSPPIVPPGATENEAPPAKIYLLPQKGPE